MLPLLISVPHGGVIVPLELKEFCRLDIAAILRDGDTWARQLYDLKSQVPEFVHFPLARAVVDVNRDPADRPPKNPDGVVKTLTVESKPVWSKPEILTTTCVESLLYRYYYPYHGRLSVAAKNREIVLGLDCHTMLDRAPVISDNPGEQRPLICLGNRGDDRGEQEGDEPLTAPPSLIRSLQESLQHWFADIKYNNSMPVVSLNRPFKGGAITIKHGRESSFPWIQVEINRALYLSNPFPHSPLPDEETLQRLAEIRRRFVGALATVVGR